MNNSDLGFPAALSTDSPQTPHASWEARIYSKRYTVIGSHMGVCYNVSSDMFLKVAKTAGIVSKE